MQPILTDSDRYEKMDLLLGSLIKEPDATILDREFGRTVKDLDPAEIQLLKIRLIHDGAIVQQLGPRGLEVSITEAGIDFFISGGYSRDWSQWASMAQITRKESPAKGRMRLLWIILVLGVITLLFFAFKR